MTLPRLYAIRRTFAAAPPLRHLAAAWLGLGRTPAPKGGFGDLVGSLAPSGRAGVF
ncbi:MAG TPA: hypothetical protein VKS60_00240 [Stellaceae bacterium]|nr:hypothetical protein [Stellaceae bacterium]